MASQADWVAKIKSWVPNSFYEGKTVESALIQAIAKVFAEAEADVRDQQAQTFIDLAIGGYLDLLGSERSTERFTDEFDSDFRKRVKAAAVTSRANIPALIDLLNKIVIRGVVSIKEDFEGGIFFNRSAFFNRGEIGVTQIHNTFTVVVDKQVHEPHGFFDRGMYLDRGAFGGSFMGQVESSARVFDLLIKTINENKAFGTLFRIVERTQ